MHNTNVEKWSYYAKTEDKGPYIVLIHDIDWWDTNRNIINIWFDKNCPLAKPDAHDTIIWFTNRNQYSSWCSIWR